MEKRDVPPLTTGEVLAPTEHAICMTRDAFNIYSDKYGLSKKDEDPESYDEQTVAIKESLITTKTQLKSVEIFLSIGGVNIIESGDIYGVKGKPKSGKTSANKAMIVAALTGEFCGIKAKKEGLKIVYIDTEQKPSDTQQILKNLVYQAGDVPNDYIDSHFHLLAFRKRDYTTLANDLLRVVIDYRPDIIIADGIADFVSSFNDEVASKDIILLELRIVEDFDCAIINLIHENKAYDDHNPKGHLGQLLAQKCAMMMETTNQGEIIKVKCTEKRHKLMPDWYLMYNEQGMLVDAQESYSNVQSEKKSKDASKVDAERVSLAHSIIKEAETPINRAELSKRMAEKSGYSRSTMSSFITSQIGKTLYIIGDKIFDTPEPELDS